MSRMPGPARLCAVLVAPVLAFAGGCSLRAVAVAEQLGEMSPHWVRAHHETYQRILERAFAADAYVCAPTPREVFWGEIEFGSRWISGTMPHYNFYHGPMRYRVVRSRSGWLVSVRIVVDPPEIGGVMELPDCRLAPQLEGPVQCAGRAFTSSGSLETCPDVGTFTAQVTPNNVGVLLADWSREVERYYNRDARAEGLPVRYDFEFSMVEAANGELVSLELPLDTSCGRTPYFWSVRSGWTLPILAHEMGHTLGLLDEYEMLSGIIGFYPKTAFEGAERSRMGLSMRERSMVLPIHHYLVLRRYFCPEPVDDNPYGVPF